MTQVYVLTAEVTGPEPGDYDGRTSVHATLEGALKHFDHWLHENQIDRDAVHYADVEVGGTFVGGDPDPDLLDGLVLHWGINKTEVHA